MLRKCALVAALLSIVAVASVPVFAQDGYENAFTEEEERATAEEAGLVYVDPDRGFSCSFLNYDPSSVCIADEDGFYMTKSGVRFPVGETDEDTYRAFIQYGGVPGSEPPPQPAS